MVRGIACLAMLGIALSVGLSRAHAYSEECSYESLPPFIFDATRVEIGWKKPSRELSAVDTASGSFETTFFGMTAVPEAVAGLFNLCVPESFAIATHFGWDGFLGKLDLGKGTGTSLVGHVFHINPNFRWYVEPPVLPRAEAIYLGLGINHFSLHNGDSITVNYEEVSMLEYAALAGLDISRAAPIDAVYVEAASQFFHGPDDLLAGLRYAALLRYTLWQANPADFFKSFRDKSTRASYNRPWFFRVSGRYPDRPGVGIALDGALETGDETFHRWRIVLDFSSRRFAGHHFGFFREFTFGIPKNTLVFTQDGLWTPTETTGIQWEYRPLL